MCGPKNAANVKLSISCRNNVCTLYRYCNTSISTSRKAKLKLVPIRTCRSIEPEIWKMKCGIFPVFRPFLFTFGIVRIQISLEDLNTWLQLFFCLSSWNIQKLPGGILSYIRVTIFKLNCHGVFCNDDCSKYFFFPFYLYNYV